uniref:Transmembrane protein n=1 Tax=Leishmania guyanensis TaxID=5670 RepID=A0A1E1J923_LEIGU|nr:hypothetical protein, unknown function [Leishmania guyanensis]
MAPMRQQQQQQSLLHFDEVDSSTLKRFLTESLGGGEGVPAVSHAVARSVIDQIVQRALQQLISFGIPIAATSAIRDLQYDLGGSRQPVNENWSKAYKWAVVLIVISSVICFAVVALVLGCILLERHREAQEKANGTRCSDSDDDNTHSLRGHFTRSFSMHDSHSEVEDCSSFSDSYDDEGEEDEWHSRNDWRGEHHGRP